MNFANFRRALAMLLIMAVVFTVLPPVSVSAASDSWTISKDTGIFLVKNADTEKDFDALAAQVRLFSTELAEKVTGTPLEIVYGEEDQAGAYDIILELDSSLGIVDQGYQVTATESSIKIAASDADGLFYGCRYLMKQLLLNGSVASVSDAPWVGERAVSLDNGRKYFSVDWIKELIREMSWANMNALVLHFSEEMGLGIESELYPWLAGRDGTLCVATDLGGNYDGRYLTQEEVVEIIEYAKLYHIDVIPSLDSPGHMNYMVKKFNEQCANQPFTFTYDGVTYTAPAGHKIGNYFEYNGTKTDVVPGSRNTAYSRGINIADEIAVAFTKSLIEEYAILFGKNGSTKFDIGGDELLGWGSAVSSSVSKWKQLDHWKRYAQSRAQAEGKSNWASAVAYDGFLYYMNDLNELVRKLGYTSVRMWNDDALRSSDTGWTGVVQLDTNIDIWFWTAGSNSNYVYTKAGYEVYNIIETYCYYVLNDAYVNGTGYQKARPQSIYDNWNPYEFGTNSSDVRYYAEWHDSDVLGGALGIWCDNPSLKTEAQMMEDLRPLIRVNAAKSWNAHVNGSVDYATHTANWTTYGNAPKGTTAAPEIYVIPDLTALEAAVAEYENVDGTLYTEDSYAAYTEAVKAGKALLTAEKPWQAEVDAAAAAIEAAKAALSLLPAADTTELEALIAAYGQTDQAQYTGESFIPYMAAVAEGKSLLTSGVFTASQLDAAVAAIREAEAALEVTSDNAVSCILGGSVRSKRVYVNKVATFTVSTDKNADTVGLRVVDENGKEIEATRYVLNTRKTARDIHTFIFKVTAEDRGIHTYTIYAVLSDGTLSADSIQFTIEVR